MTCRLSSGSRTDSSGREELALAVSDIDNSRAQLAEGSLDEFRFAFAHQAGIDIDAAHARRPEGAQAESKGDGGIHAAADEKEDVAVADALANLVFDERDALTRVPVFRAVADVEDEVCENSRAVRRMDDFGVELHAVESARGVFDGSDVAGGSAWPRTGSRAAARSPRRDETSRSAGDR